jgi:hypothetical protein
MAHQPSVFHSTNSTGHSELLCPICDHPIQLETATTDENWNAFHEECYVLKVELKRASGR